jgi:heptosyltransferase-1
MDLQELISFISACDLTIGNDTGPTHIAWAQNVASITLFGPTNERMISQTPKNIALNSPSKVDIKKIDKNDYSIKEIKPEVVSKKAMELLKW